MPGRAPPRAAWRAAGWRSAIPANGGCIFAEHPDVAAPDARIIWHADLDPGTLRVVAAPATGGDPDGIDPKWIEPWLTIVTDEAGAQHVVLSDGRRRIRIDIDDGKLVLGRPVVLHYQLYGVDAAAARVLPLRRLLRLIGDRRFPVALFRKEPVSGRDISLLRVSDALDDKASLRDIARALFGDDRVAADRDRGSDSLRSRVRRLVSDARSLAAGGYRHLMHRRTPR